VVLGLVLLIDVGWLSLILKIKYNFLLEFVKFYFKLLSDGQPARIFNFENFYTYNIYKKNEDLRQ
jgi:hypothetical protein